MCLIPSLRVFFTAKDPQSSEFLAKKLELVEATPDFQILIHPKYFKDGNFIFEANSIKILEPYVVSGLTDSIRSLDEESCEEQDETGESERLPVRDQPVQFDPESERDILTPEDLVVPRRVSSEPNLFSKQFKGAEFKKRDAINLNFHEVNIQPTRTSLGPRVQTRSKLNVDYEFEFFLETTHVTDRANRLNSYYNHYEQRVDRMSNSHPMDFSA